MSAERSLARDPIPVLLYHSVSDRPTGQFGPYTVTRAQLASHLDQVNRLGFSTRTVGQLVAQRAAGIPLPARTAVITFDDGFADFDNAWAELSQRGLAATLYVTVGTLGGHSEWLAPLGAGDLPMLSRSQLLDLAADGCEIGAHSMSHPQLDCIARTAAATEIRDSKDGLEQALGRSVETFAYPHGYHDNTVKQLVAEAGYSSAAAVRNALSPADDDPFALARVTITADFSAEQVARVLTGQGAPIARRRERLRTRLWRQERRRRHSRAARMAA
jgi:peptidoglycan/xylan/chitin deacetylase (PgdA/CDA1 family)